MAEECFDAVIIGAGLAGSAAATVLARAGASVLLVERSTVPGAKSMSGGRVYAYSMEKVWPGFRESAPLERVVTRETISMVDGDSVVNFDLEAPGLGQQGRESYTVLRGQFDQWAAAQAEAAGAELVCGVTAESLLYKKGKVAGIICDGEEVEAKAVILAEGASGKLAQSAGLKVEMKPGHAAIGFKEVIELPEEVINQRFNLQPGSGAARLFAGSLTGGLAASGGFLYTNKNSLSFGMVISLAAAMQGKKPVHEYLEEFKQHPAMLSLLEGGVSVEYSAHLVPEGGFNALPMLYADNLLLAGDAAGMVINHGYTVRGMDLAICAGLAAAGAILECKGDNAKSKLGPAYERELSSAQVLTHLKAYRNMPSFIDTSRLTSVYPKLTADIFKDMFTFDGSAPRPMLTGKLLPKLRKVGFLNLIKDAWKARGAL